MRAPARLSGELLARKGQALPTGGLAYATMTFDQPLPAYGPPVLVRHGSLPAQDARAHGGSRRTTAEPRRPPAGRREEDRVALTLRLDRARHRRLRIFCARHECSSQEVIVRALDAYLETCGEDCACLRGETEDCVRN
jgi:hypothetical protein